MRAATDGERRNATVARGFVPGSLACIVAVAAASPAGAQESERGPVFARYSRPMRSVSLDLATGTVSRGAKLQERAGTTVSDFSNIDLGGFVGADTGAGACEWFSAGTKGFAGNASDLMSEIVFAYCTVMADVASGGPGGSTLLGFYEGYQQGGPAPTTAVALLNLTGLPGHSANSSFLAFVTGSGNATCHFIHIDFASCIAFADGPIGYSWRFTDVGTTNILAGTFPFLACVQSCSGAGPDGQGMVDVIDRYCPPGTLVPPFSWPTIPPSGSYFNSISMDIREVADAEAVATSWTGDGINLDQLSTGAIAIGASWQVNIALGHFHDVHGATNVKVRSSCVNGPSFSSPSGHAAEVLTTGPLSLTLADAHDGTSTSYAPFAVPCDITLVGLAWAAQGTVLGGGRVDLTSARCGVVGSIDAAADP